MNGIEWIFKSLLSPDEAGMRFDSTATALGHCFNAHRDAIHREHQPWAD